MVLVVEDGLVGDLQHRILREGVACVRVAIVHGEIATGDLDADAVARLEEVARRPDVDVVAVGEARLDQRGVRLRVPVARTLHAVLDEHRGAIGIDVVELGDEVGVAGARGRVERHRDRPGDLDALLQRRGRVDQYVGPAEERPLIVRPSRHRGLEAATDARHRIGRIVRERVSRGLAIADVLRLVGAEPAVAVHGVRLAAAVKIELAILGAGQWPRLGGAPPVRAHHEDAHLRVMIGPILNPFEPAVEPPQLQCIDRIGRLRAEVDLPYLLHPRDMQPRTDHELLVIAREP